MKVKKILISQPKPAGDKSPYFDLAKKNNIQIDFRPFTEVEPLSAKEFRTQKINILDHTAVVFTSRTAIDHFFHLVKELRLTIPESMKYFCVNEASAFYLQKYIVYRKRKIFYGEGRPEELYDLVLKHREEKYFVPLSDGQKQELCEKLDQNTIDYTKATLFKTVHSNLADLNYKDYDILTFFSPAGVASFKQTFSDFEQGSLRIATFGPATASIIKESGFQIEIEAPQPEAPSMAMALDVYLKKLTKELAAAKEAAKEAAKNK